MIAKISQLFSGIIRKGFTLTEDGECSQLVKNSRLINLITQKDNKLFQEKKNH